MKHLISLNDLSKEEINGIIDLGIDIKNNIEKYSDKLKGKTMALLFEKNSTRTRCSFESGFAKLGGNATFIDWKTTQLGKARLQDEIRCIARYFDIITARVYEHKNIKIMAEYSPVPIVNGLSDASHPCQILSDLMTIKEKKGKLEGLKLAYVGDGNNVCNSLIVGCKKVGMIINVATPEGYEPKEKPDLLTTDPKEATKDADIVYTDTWISMGQEEEAEKRKEIFPPYKVNKEILGGALFMHCLPAYIGYEVTEDVLESEQSIVFDQAENKMWAQLGVILKLLELQR